MAEIVARQILKAQKIIVRAVNQWVLKRMSKQRKFMADIYYEADHDIADKIYLVGEFTTPKWIIKIPMKYSFYHRAFKVKVKISDK